MAQDISMLVGRLDERTATISRRLDQVEGGMRRLERDVSAIAARRPQQSRLRQLWPEAALALAIAGLLSGHLTLSEVKALLMH